MASLKYFKIRGEGLGLTIVKRIVVKAKSGLSQRLAKEVVFMWPCRIPKMPVNRKARATL